MMTDGGLDISETAMNIFREATSLLHRQIVFSFRFFLPMVTFIEHQLA